MIAASSIQHQLYCASVLAYSVNQKGGFTPHDPHDNPYLKNLGSYINITPFSNLEGNILDKINAAILVEYSDHCILAFRGTLLTGFNCPTIQDWLQDVILTNLKKVRGWGGVHEGFYNAYFSLKKAIFKTLKQVKSKPLFITGHSKGGPMASYGAFDAIKKGYLVRGIVTFASPRPGDDVFAKNYHNLTHSQRVTQIRFENDLDMVPLLPPEPNHEVHEIILALEIIGGLVAIKDLELALKIEVFAQALKEFLEWNYQPVGELQYITKDHQIVPYSTGLWEVRKRQFINDFENNWRDPVQAVRNIFGAHKIAIGGGYQQGVFPGI